MRNESLESFEVLPECYRLKHHSSSSLTSVIQPSSVSSNSTTISDYASNGNNLRFFLNKNKNYFFKAKTEYFLRLMKLIIRLNIWKYCLLLANKLGHIK